MKSIELHRLLCGATLFAAIALGSNSAMAQAFEGEGFGGILRGFGLADSDDDEKAAIDFRERAPLVVPPSRQMPAPGTTGSIAAQQPNFPVDADRKDPNVARARKLWDEQMLRNNTRLSPEEMEADTLAPGSTKRAVAKPAQADVERKTTLSGKQMTNVHKIQEEERWDKAEPRRTRLSDPPVGYRAPASTAPYTDKNGKTVAQSGGSSFWSRINPF